MTPHRSIANRLMLAVATAINDDETQPGSEERRRHLERVAAMLDAREALLRLTEGSDPIT